METDCTRQNWNRGRKRDREKAARRYCMELCRTHWGLPLGQLSKPAEQAAAFGCKPYWELRMKLQSITRLRVKRIGELTFGSFLIILYAVILNEVVNKLTIPNSAKTVIGYYLNKE